MVQVNAVLVQAGPSKGPSKKSRFYGLGPSGPGIPQNLKYARGGVSLDTRSRAWVKIQAFYLDHLDPAPFHGHLRDRLTCARPVPDLCHLSSEVSL